MVTLLRLDPGLPPLWRTERILQFGIDPVASVVDPAPWQERFVRELERGIPSSALPVLAAEYGVDLRAVRDFLDHVAPAVAPGARLGADRVVVEIAAEDDTADALVGALTASGIVPDVVDGDDRTPRLSDRSVPRIVVAHNALDPGRARAAMREDAPHLPIVFSGTRAMVGPLVVPGRTACLACVDAHRYDADLVVADAPRATAGTCPRTRRPQPRGGGGGHRRVAHPRRGVRRSSRSRDVGRPVGVLAPPVVADPPPPRTMRVPISVRKRDGWRGVRPRPCAHVRSSVRPARVMPT